MNERTVAEVLGGMIVAIVMFAAGYFSHQEPQPQAPIVITCEATDILTYRIGYSESITVVCP